MTEAKEDIKGLVLSTGHASIISRRPPKLQQNNMQSSLVVFGNSTLCASPCKLFNDFYAIPFTRLVCTYCPCTKEVTFESRYCRLSSTSMMRFFTSYWEIVFAR